jgi:hypothetical protein
MALGSGIVLASKQTGPGADWINGLTPGGSVQVGWSDGYAGVLDSLGGMPVLVDNGAVVAKNDCGTYFCSRNHRTAAGVTADGKILLVTVDGRCTCSLGMTLVGLANEMKSLGAVYALNLDGGGGTTMWVKGQGIVNRPSDPTGERPVTNAIVILPGPDSGEPIPLSGLVAPVGPLVRHLRYGARARHGSAASGGDDGECGPGDAGRTARVPDPLGSIARTSLPGSESRGAKRRRGGERAPMCRERTLLLV